VRKKYHSEALCNQMSTNCITSNGKRAVTIIQLKQFPCAPVTGKKQGSVFDVHEETPAHQVHPDEPFVSEDLVLPCDDLERCVLCARAAF